MSDFMPLGLTRYDYYGNATHYLPVSFNQGEINVGLPEVTITPRNNLDLAGAVRQGMNNAARKGISALTWTTPLGDVEGVYNIGNDVSLGNYGQAAIGAGLFLLPNAVEKPLKKAIRSGKRFVRHINTVKNPSDYLLPLDEIASKKTTSDLGYDRYYAIPLYTKKDLRSATHNYANLQRENIRLPLEIHKYFGEKSYNLETKSELLRIFTEDPRYFDFIRTNNLDPLDQNTVNKFLKKQFTHIRGVNFPGSASDDLVHQALTTNNAYNKGGDRLNTAGTGVYVSNSGEIADRFSRPWGDNPNTRSDIAIVTYPHNIDSSLPIRELLALARRKIFPFDAEKKTPYEVLSKHGYVAKESLYTQRNGNVLPGYERAYIDKDIDKELLNVEDQSTRYGLEDDKGRWALNGVSSTPELEAKLFEGNNIGYSFGDFVHFMKTLMDPENVKHMGLEEWFKMYSDYSMKVQASTIGRSIHRDILIDRFKKLNPYKVYEAVTNPTTTVKNLMNEVKIDKIKDLIKEVKMRRVIKKHEQENIKKYGVSKKSAKYGRLNKNLMEDEE